MTTALDSRFERVHIDCGTGCHLIGLKPTTIGLDREEYFVAGGGHRIFVIGEKVVYFPEPSIGAEISDIQRNPGVAHPETAAVRALKQKEHAVIGWQRLPKHQPSLLFTGRQGQLEPQLVPADGDGEIRRLIGRLKRCASGWLASGQQQERTAAGENVKICFQNRKWGSVRDRRGCVDMIVETIDDNEK